MRSIILIVLVMLTVIADSVAQPLESNMKSYLKVLLMNSIQPNVEACITAVPDMKSAMLEELAAANARVDLALAIVAKTRGTELELSVPHLMLDSAKAFGILANKLGSREVDRPQCDRLISDPFSNVEVGELQSLLESLIPEAMKVRAETTATLNRLGK